MTSQLNFQASQAHFEDLRHQSSAHAARHRPERHVRRLFASLLEKPAQAFRTAPSITAS